MQMAAVSPQWKQLTEIKVTVRRLKLEGSALLVLIFLSTYSNKFGSK